MKRITFFILSLASGGAEHQLCILANLLQEKGYKVSITTFGEADDHYRLDPTIERVVLGKGLSKWRKLVIIFKHFKNLDSDVVIGFGARYNCFMLFPLLFNKKRILKIAGERCAWFGRYPWYESVNLKFLYKTADYIVPNSYAQTQQILRVRPEYTPKTITITNYTDTSKYQVAQLPNNEIIRIGIFCRYEKQKNFHRFIEVIKQLKDEGYTAFHVDWYGDLHLRNPILQQYIEDGKALIKQYKVGDLITLNDKTKKVDELLPTFDVLCLPSLFEGFSNSISEYICCGRPVLCSDVADNSVMVRNCENGYLFNPLDVYSMVNAFKNFFALSIEERKHKAARSREIAEELFKKEKFVESYINLIESK